MSILSRYHPLQPSRRSCAAVLAAALLAACGQSGPGATTAASAASAAPANATVGPASQAPDPTPSTTTVDGVTVTSVSLGARAAPIDVVSAFDSIWVSLHHQGAVSRIDPVTLEETARIQVGSGPGWFAVTEDAIWISSQMARGLTRIDPATNTATVEAGDEAPCGAPVYAAGSVWQFGCDAQSIMRIDPATHGAIDIAASGYVGVGQVADEVFAVGPEHISRVNLRTNELEPVAPGAEGFPVLFDDAAVWLAAPGGINRIGIADGKLLATLKVGGEAVITTTDDHAWVTQNGFAVYEADLAAAAVTRTLRLKSPTLAREVDGIVWVTSFDGSTLSMFRP